MGRKKILNEFIQLTNDVVGIKISSKKYGQKIAMISFFDKEKISIYKWSLKKDKAKFYVHTRTQESKKKSITIHRLIMDFPDLFIDHIDGNPLNNIRGNLRLATASQNRMNNRKSTKRRSIFKGVYQRNDYFNVWRAQVRFNGQTINLGNFNDPLRARDAYNKKAKELFGEFACFD